MPWYRSGTVAITAGQTTVTGTGTNFSANARVGDAFQGPDGRWYEVTNIPSATVLSILPAYQGATVSAGSYGLAPMQGYVKESADRLRQFADDFGSTMALFGGATTAAGLRQNIGAAARGANNDITSLSGLVTALSVAQGGTGGTTQAAARTGLGLKAAAVADIVGTVSQSGGVPTGAIIERGSNSNGEYVRFADGTQICWGVTSDIPDTLIGGFYGTTAGNLYYKNITANLPIGFSGVYRITGTARDRGICGIAVRSTNTTFMIQVRHNVTGVEVSCDWIAIGRWY
ncbi:phage tail protein [Pseudomonas guariconensis]|uniref:phage tail protein n=1 Tax=Pseudomonas guariconensis TaxID=1288410 RepID=UPI002D1F3AFB|nr:phage tail protein [Pseudomonas guariconensis]MEB3840457.1 phage tail protein [Pseudomonas guariconensis]MEB3873325.1 phage tail protein [Pseudomonas guariconensis]MEB3879692.1 phage tail protein [Pseudomonas guariconensis]MEB3895852.1 phage tail protein [Pseudomonas guariconensis]